MTTAEDRLIYPVLARLRTCAATQLGLIRRPVCRFPLYAGDQAMPADDCDCTCDGGGQGTAWLRFVSATSSTTMVTGARRQIPSPCAQGEYAVTVQVGVWRCAPTIDDNGRPPTDDAYDQFTRGMSRDSSALIRTFQCCDALTSRDIEWSIESVRPLGPSGGCAGVAVQARMQLWSCDCPDEPVREQP